MGFGIGLHRKWGICEEEKVGEKEEFKWGRRLPGPEPARAFVNRHGCVVFLREQGRTREREKR
jgi:hypothetical protein